MAGFFILFFFDVDGKSGSGLDDEDGGLDYVDGEGDCRRGKQWDRFVIFLFYVDGCASAIFGLDNVGGYDDNSSCDDVDYGGTAGDCDFGILGVTPISNITAHWLSLSASSSSSC